jgi:hypothetical protein
MPEHAFSMARAITLGMLALGLMAPSAAAATTAATRPTTQPHWAFQPIAIHSPPSLSPAPSPPNPIDAFILSTLRQKDLTPSPQADRRTLIRRVSYDLTGLPPSPQEIADFEADPAPDAYEKLVDRLLASPRYGERWARHWLDTVHYGDTHGYDKDKIRLHAWPYRDYVVRAFNQDKPYDRFVKEQLAGDVLYPDSTDGIVALGMIAAGPFDAVGQLEVRDGTIDKTITRNLDRDDMVTTVMNTFVSLTVQCARCHNHKFDPISQEDYYSLQAVFAGVDRADRLYDAEPRTSQQRLALTRQIAELQTKIAGLELRIPSSIARKVAEIDRQVGQIQTNRNSAERPEYGYHSAVAPTQETTKWVQVDLGEPTPVSQVVLIGAHDSFNHIGDGFGFPERFKIEASQDPAFLSGVVTIVDHTADDFPNPGVRPQHFATNELVAQYIRVTATKLAPRLNDFIFAMGEMSVVSPAGNNAALHKRVTALDSIEAPVRWSKKNLVDGIYFPGADPVYQDQISALLETRRVALEHAFDPATRDELKNARQAKSAAAERLKSLPEPMVAFAATSDFAPSGSFTPTHGKARPIHLLNRGSEKSPGKEVGPGTVSCLKDLTCRFDIAPDADESQRRAALATWVVDARNPLTWRSIVNRVWQYHFGHGIVDSPSDFGKMGATPTHPELLDFLAAQFRDGGPWIKTPRSLKALHRLIVTSQTYRQSSAGNPENEKLDSSNQYLWRMNRDRLSAEAIRDTVLLVSGQLDLTMGGPGYMAFGFRDDHSPHYKYAEYNPDDAATHRRSIYRLIVRSVPDPFMETLDCADPSQLVPRRNETLTPLSALALLNDKFMVRMSEHFAQRVRSETPDLHAQVERVYQLALGRSPTAAESQILISLAQKDGLESVCRLVFNTNEFLFVD